MRREKGLTTNELLVSVATLAAVMGMAFAAFRGLGGAAESSSARVRAASEARWVFLRLDSVLPAVASHTLAGAGRYSFWGEEGGAVWEVSAPRELGPPSRSFEKVSLHFRRDEGLVVLTGPAGSGKTTTIYASVQHVRDSSRAGGAGGSGRHIVTIEDPVECLLPGATQTQTNPPAGLTFANCLGSILRQDPEVIVVGEVRDAATAELALQAALTGHLVVTTVHAGTAPGVSLGVRYALLLRVTFTTAG